MFFWTLAANNTAKALEIPRSSWSTIELSLVRLAEDTVREPVRAAEKLGFGVILSEAKNRSWI